MITRNDGKDIPCRMKLSHYLRYYQERHGIPLDSGEAEKEALKEGIVLDFGGETRQPYGEAGRERKKNAV